MPRHGQESESQGVAIMILQLIRVNFYLLALDCFTLLDNLLLMDDLSVLTSHHSPLMGPQTLPFRF